MKKITLFILFLLIPTLTGFAQTEILTNAEIIEMSQAGLGKDVILQKIKSTGSNYDVSAKALVELKKANVEDEVITLILEKSKTQPERPPLAQIQNGVVIEKKSLTPADILRSARTIAFHKDSMNPSRQALEKELLKRPEWKKINLAITEDKDNADLSVQIGFVHFSLLTHRYVFRVFDRRSGMLIAAGETTSWGSLAENLARNMAKSLNDVLEK